MKKMKVYINGRFTDISSAKVSVSDRGFLYGDGAFETMRAYAGIVFKLDAHLDRLFHSLKVINIRPPLRKKDIGDAVSRAIKINKLKSAYIRLAITRGEGRFGIDARQSFKPNIYIIIKDFKEYPKKLYERGISACIVRSTRQNEYSPVSRIKSMNFLNYILARLEARDRGFDEAILVNTKGYISEGATSNIFLVSKGKLITPSIDSGILPGITRSIIMKLAKRSKIRVTEKRLLPEELMKAGEVFFTNSIAEVLPVTRIGHKYIGKGKVGHLTKLLLTSYQKEVISEGRNSL